MIPANELKLNNWVIIKGKQTQITSIGEKGVNLVIDDYGHCPVNMWTLFKDVQPIEISPAILEVCGFVKVTNQYQNNFVINISRDKKYSVKFDKDTWGEKEYWWVSNDESDAGCYVLAGILYLHELQNILFALEKFELEAKLNESTLA